MFGNFRRFGSVWFGYRFYTQPTNVDKNVNGQVSVLYLVDISYNPLPPDGNVAP